MPPSKRQRRMIKSVTKKDKSFKAGVRKSSDWREDPTIYKIRSRYAMEQGILTDVTFAVGPQKTLFSAHKIFLGFASPVFEAIFFASNIESNDIIYVPDITPGGFKLFLEFVYTDAIRFTNEIVDGLSAMFAAQKYCMPHMESLCFKYLNFCQIQPSNVWTVLHYSFLFKSKIMLDKCVKYLKYHASDALKSPTFVEASKKCIEYLVKLDNYNLKEVELLNSIAKWGKERKGAGESVQQILQPFMKHIRFACMTQQELISFVDLHKNIISDKDVNELLKYMSDNETYSLPEWCSANVLPRKAKEEKYDFTGFWFVFVFPFKYSQNER